jgi:hypothetical protein
MQSKWTNPNHIYYGKNFAMGVGNFFKGAKVFAEGDSNVISGRASRSISISVPESYNSPAGFIYVREEFSHLPPDCDTIPDDLGGCQIRTSFDIKELYCSDSRKNLERVLESGSFQSHVFGLINKRGKQTERTKISEPITMVQSDDLIQDPNQASSVA